MTTIILMILFRMGIIRKAHSGSYFCDYFGIRITFNYLKIRKHQNPKDICGNWHGITLFNWDIHWLIPDKKPRKIRILFP